MAYVKKELVLNSLNDLSHKKLIGNDNDIFISLAEAKDLIEELPNEDVEEIKSGEWIEINSICGVSILKCPHCKNEHPRLPTLYCCDCGAKMKKKER